MCRMVLPTKNTIAVFSRYRFSRYGAVVSAAHHCKVTVYAAIGAVVLDLVSPRFH
jgi:hypothetical protein